MFHLQTCSISPPPEKKSKEQKREGDRKQSHLSREWEFEKIDIFLGGTERRFYERVEAPRRIAAHLSPLSPLTGSSIEGDPKPLRFLLSPATRKESSFVPGYCLVVFLSTAGVDPTCSGATTRGPSAVPYVARVLLKDNSLLFRGPTKSKCSSRAPKKKREKKTPINTFGYTRGFLFHIFKYLSFMFTLTNEVPIEVN